MELKPDYAKAYYNRGNTKRNLGNISGARGDYQRTLDLAQEAGEANLVAEVQRNLRRLGNDNTEEPWPLNVGTLGGIKRSGLRGRVL